MAVKGPWTGVDLSDVSTLFLRPAYPMGGYQGAPNHSRRTAQLSLELSAAAYTMDPERWTQAGWRDFSMLVNRSLLTGPMLNSSVSPINDLTRATLQTLAKLKMSALNPIGQVQGLRQPQEETSSLKAIVMQKPANGLFVIAIGFMGTGRQLGDWLPNLRMEPQDGLHGGFLQLTQEFWGVLDQIVFGSAAHALGRPSLSLNGVIDALKRPGARFRLWVSGHSQGAAVAQVFIDRLLREGVLPQYICGFGFASPSVAYPGRALPAQGYPITHLLNADDVVPRVGAWCHMGECLTFAPQPEDRRRMYGAQAEAPCFREAQRLLLQTEAATDALQNAIAILRVLRQQSEVSLRKILRVGEQVPLLDFLNGSEDSLLRLLDRLCGRLESGYLAISGEDVLPEDALARRQAVWSALLTQYGMAEWFKAIRDACLLPHRLYLGQEYTPAYRYIVGECLPRLTHTAAFAAQRTALCGGEARVRPAARSIYPTWSSGRTFHPAARRKPDLTPALQLPIADESTVPDEVTAVQPPAAPQQARRVPLPANRLSRYAAAFRLLSASRARNRKP